MRREIGFSSKVTIHRGGVIAAVLVSALILGSVELVQAAAGDLDPSFDGDGKVLTDFGNSDQAFATAIQTDGKIVAAGGSGSDFALARYNTDGSLDNTFDGDGKTITNFGAGSASAYGVAIQSDGKIVAVGSTALDFALARYNTDGSLDNTFGAGGMVTTDFFGSLDKAFAVAIQSDGKIVVAGFCFSLSGNVEFALARYNTNGALDGTFGTSGKVATSLTGNLDAADAIVIQPDGKMIAAGRAGNAWGLVRYNSDGSLDTAFGTNGVVITDFTGDTNSAGAGEVLVQSDGKIVAAGITINATKDLALARYDSNGSLDTTFGTNGKVSIDFAGGDDSGQAAAIQSDGKIVVAGVASVAGSPEFALARFDSSGTLDSTFGTGGKVTTDFPGNSDAGNAIAIQADGKIVVAGFAFNGTDYDFAVARYQGDAASGCLFCDEFDDGVLAADWTYVKQSWAEAGGNLTGTPTGKKAEAIASPAFSGCSVCTVETSMQTAGGTGNQLALLAWFQDKNNYVEVLMKQETNKWIIKQRVNGVVVASAKGSAAILPNTAYDVKIAFDGTNFTLTVDGTTIATMHAAGVPGGTVGFLVKKTIGNFAFIHVN